MGPKCSFVLSSLEYTREYLFDFGPISLNDPLYAHESHICLCFIIDRIPTLMHRRSSHFPLERWSTPTSPIFALAQYG